MSKKPPPQGDKDHDRDSIIHIQHPDHRADNEHADDRDHHHEDDWTDVQPPLVLPPPSAPMQVARVFMTHSLMVDGIPDAPTLRYYRGGWWVWRTTHWAEVENRTVRSLLYAFTEHAVYADTFMGMPITKPWRPNRRKIGDLLEALGSITILPDDIDQPSGSTIARAAPSSLWSNGLLDLVSRESVSAHAALLQPDQRAVRLRATCREAATVAELSRCAVAAGRRTRSTFSLNGAATSSLAGLTCTRSC